jgi:hypothetical protein
MTAGVYILVLEGTKNVKIGMSLDMDTRLKRMRNKLPVDFMAFVCKCEQPKRIERRIHNVYKDLRLHGEWFSLDNSIVDLIFSAPFEFYKSFGNHFDMEVPNKYFIDKWKSILKDSLEEIYRAMSTEPF